MLTVVISDGQWRNRVYVGFCSLTVFCLSPESCVFFLLLMQLVLDWGQCVLCYHGQCVCVCVCVSLVQVCVCVFLPSPVYGLQDTPASSMWSQLCCSQPLRGHSSRESSFPEHCTASSRMGALRWPNSAQDQDLR